jgi:DNA-binding CsgD family transcriptional regulator
VDELEALWPDPDRRVAALARLAERMARPERALTAMEVRCLQVLSHGSGNEAGAVLLGIGVEAFKDHTKRARRVLKAKDSTHAVAQALRLGLIS